MDVVLSSLRRLLIVAVGLLTVGAVTEARATLVLLVAEQGGPTIPIVDGGPFDSDGLVNGNVDVNVSLLNLALVDFQFSGLSATSNQLTGTPLSADPAQLTQTGSVQRTGATGTSSIFIVATDSGFLFPNPPALMNTSASNTFTNANLGTMQTFQSFYDPTDTPPTDAEAVPGGIPSTLLSFIGPLGLGPFSLSGNAPVTGLTGDLPFTLSNQTVFTAGPGGTNGPRLQFTGATTVIIPEPSSLTMVGLGLLATGLVVARRNRRRLS